MSWRPIGLGLNAREPAEDPEERAPESGEESALPEDPISPLGREPLGMASVRRLGGRLRKLGRRVRPALHRLWLWVPLLARKARRGLAAVGRWANKGHRLAKAGAAGARRITNLGRGLQRTGGDWSRAGGRLGSFGQRAVRFGKGLEALGVWLEQLAAGAVSLTAALRDLAPKLRDARQVRKARRKLRREAVREARRQAAELPGRRLLLRPERGDDEEPARPAAAVPESAPGPVGTPAAKPASLPEGPAVADAPPASATGPELPGEPAPDPVEPAPERLPRHMPSSSPAAPEPPAAARTLRSRAFDELPFHVAGAVVSLRGWKRPRKEHVREVILLLLESGERRSAAELADWIGMRQETLTRGHLGPLVDAGRIEREFPNRITHPEQTYRAVRPRTAETG